MRAWGLAQGLIANGVQATVAINNSFPQEYAEHEGVKLVNWGIDEQFAQLINSYDAVIISYCMGDASVFVADRIAPEVQLILDVYVPIYIEVSAREAKDMDTEYPNYMEDLKRFNHTLKRGDYFLCANEAQKVFYTGVLASLGVINPRSYRDPRILIVPFGIHNEPAVASENPYLKLGVKEDDFVVLWFGGLYPWFRVQELLDAIKELSSLPNMKFVFVGGKNPFNSNPDFLKQYEKTVTFMEEHKLTDSSVYFMDWVDFNERVNWFKHADVVISLNQPGEENGLSWRTRVMDFVWGELAILTNGGDPLSEDLLAHNAAIKLSELSSSAIAQELTALYENPSKLHAIRAAIVEQQKRYQWPLLLKPVVEVIHSHNHPFIDESAYKRQLGIATAVASLAAPSSGKIRKLARFAKKSVNYARRKGIRRSAKVAVTIARNVATSKAHPRKKQYIFISHPINHTGAPLVLLEIVEEYARKYGARNIRLVAPDVTKDQMRHLKELGIKVDKAALGIGFRLIAMQLGLHKNDFLLMNTVAIYDNYRNFVLHALETGRLNHAHWFIHEDIAQLNVISRELILNKHVHDKIRKLIKQDKLTVMVPSVRIKQDYDEFFKVNKTKTIPLHVDVPEQYKRERDARDYAAINFLLSGTSSDGRKGQLIAISALHNFMKIYYEKNPDQYRDFKLTLIAIGDDYISQQIRSIGASLLDERLIIHPSVPKERALDIAAECNAVICCSLNETFGLYVAEGMYMGHIVLRNNSAGMEEQLIEGRNGYFIDHENVQQFTKVIERILNKKINSNKALQAMGKASQQIITPYAEHSYLAEIQDNE